MGKGKHQGCGITFLFSWVLADLNKEGIAIVMISHDIAQAVQYASHILHIGDRIFFCTKDDYLMSAAGKLFFSRRKGGNE